MTRTELLDRVSEAHGALRRALDGLTEEDATRAGLNARWSVKDALAHIAAWELEGARVITEIQNGTYRSQPFTKETIDDFNRAAVENRRARTMAEVREEFDAAHRRIVEVLEELPDDVDEKSNEYKFAEGVTFRHHKHHAAQIEEWKKRLVNRKS
jgi:uncharacterized protein (TIGR03083 family)